MGWLKDGFSREGIKEITNECSGNPTGLTDYNDSGVTDIQVIVTAVSSKSDLENFAGYDLHGGLEL